MRSCASLRSMGMLGRVPIVLWAALAAMGEDWTQFRGPDSSGVAASDATLPERWSTTENVRWKADVPGMGWSSPVVAGGKVFLTSVVSAEVKEAPKKGLYFGGERGKPTDVHRWMVYAFDAESGKLAWEREVQKAVPESTRHLKNSYASATPVTDGKRLFALFGDTGLFAIDLNGKLLWERKWPPKETRYGWGTASSPVLHEGRLYLVDDNDSESSISAIDAATGKDIWKVRREEKSNWATPFVWKNGGGVQIVTAGSGRVRSYDLDGKVLWELKGMSSISIPTPFARLGLLFVTSGYVGDPNRPVFAIREGAKGDISLAAGATSNEWIAWYLPQGGPYNPSPIVYGDYYYTLFDRGFLTCHEAKTGREVYGKVRLDQSTNAFTSSPWAYNGKVFALSEDGDTYIIQAGPEYKLLGKNPLDEMAMATPAISGGSLFIRTSSKLYRIAACPNSTVKLN